ncbi:MAG: hypothetical protein Q8J65_05730 [Nitrosomonadales bacterium]|nr:hypothetical protein [Nitrosomonadales bacterium]
MSFWDVLTYIAWSLSAIMLVWMVVDAFMVSSQYDEEFLMSSREGEDDVIHGVELDGENR